MSGKQALLQAILAAGINASDVSCDLHTNQYGISCDIDDLSIYIRYTGDLDIYDDDVEEDVYVLYDGSAVCR